MSNAHLVEALDNLTFVAEHPGTSHETAYLIAQEGYKIVNENVGIAGEPRFGTIPEEAIARFHTALAENHLEHEPTSDLTEKLWRRATVGHKQVPGLG